MKSNGNGEGKDIVRRYNQYFIPSQLNNKGKTTFSGTRISLTPLAHRRHTYTAGEWGIEKRKNAETIILSSQAPESKNKNINIYEGTLLNVVRHFIMAEE